MPKQATRAARAGKRAPRRRRKLQYTVRGVPPDVDRALRERAHRERRSLNQLLLSALAHEAGVAESPDATYDDLDYLAGRWRENRDFDRALEAQDQVDEDLWR